MGFKVERSKQSIRDLELIFRHLIQSYIGFGDPVEEAIERALQRLHSIESDMDGLAQTPYQGTVWTTESGTELRYVTKKKVVFYFEIKAEAQVINLLAVFFGGQDHRRHMLERLSKQTTNA
ncbi:type II toxin-antitoxin system RelE/ParE family toxin [Rhizobium sp. FKY42]|uniref:type II toxin-antitoxin system RelE/ParE family toxin n=1 Tax=Rhizobium sp. FKY42 TaxID=2562310 RepID=UPI0010BF6803|nr:type II toxin-antitoxin system RelE/ParE family toxin [Rhizobium sp. FKY42]